MRAVERVSVEMDATVRGLLLEVVCFFSAFCYLRDFIKWIGKQTDPRGGGKKQRSVVISTGLLGNEP